MHHDYLSPKPRTDERELRQTIRALPEPIACQFAEYIRRNDTDYITRTVFTMLIDMFEEAGMEREEARKRASELLRR